MISDPHIFTREETPTIGIRETGPFRGMLAREDQLRKELTRWLKANQIQSVGPFYMRFYVVNMEGKMDFEVGVVMDSPVEGEGHIRSSSLPAGRYIGLTYQGSGLQGNKALVEHVYANQLPVDRRDTEAGDNFACRYELFLTNTKLEHRKTRWENEVAFKLKE